MQVSDLKPSTWITFVVLTAVMAVNNIYSTLLTGWGDGGSIVAVILCVLLLRQNRDIQGYNLGQTMASAGGSVGFAAAVLASMYINQPGWNPPTWKVALMLLSLGILGCIIIIPIRRMIVKWFFPSGVACGVILQGVTSNDRAEKARAKLIMGFSGIVSAILTFPTKIALKEGGSHIWSKASLPGGMAVSFDPLLYGIGIVVGPRIGASMLLAAIVSTQFVVPRLAAAEANVGDHIRWLAVGLMTLPAFVSAGLAYAFRIVRETPPGFAPKEPSREDEPTRHQWIALSAVAFVAMVTAQWMMKDLFAVPPMFLFGSIVLAVPLCVALGRVASETDINPVRLLAIVLLSVFAFVGSFDAMALLAIGIAGATIASVAVDMMYDLRTGYLVRAIPRSQVRVQLIGVMVASFVAAWFLALLCTNFGLGEGQYFPAPGAVVWSTMADAFAKGSGALSPDVLRSLILATVIGTIIAVLGAWRWTKAIMPNPMAMGIALLLPIEMPVAIFLGGLLRLVAVRIARRNGEVAAEQMSQDAFRGGSAIFAASAITGIIAVILITLGIVHIPTDH